MDQEREKITICKQEHHGWCLLGCAQAILKRYGKEKSQEELREIFGTTVENGTSFSQAINGFKKLDYPAVCITDANIMTLVYYLKRRLPIIVDWWHDLDEEEADDGHYSIVDSIQFGFGGATIRLLDPKLEDEDIRTFTWEEFECRWWDTDTEEKK